MNYINEEIWKGRQRRFRICENCNCIMYLKKTYCRCVNNSFYSSTEERPLFIYYFVDENYRMLDLVFQRLLNSHLYVLTLLESSAIFFS